MAVVVGAAVLAGCGGDDGGTASASSTTSAPRDTAAATTTTAAPPVLPPLGPETAVGAGMPDGTYAATINSVDAFAATLGLNLVTVAQTDGAIVATDQDPLGLVDLPTTDETAILLVPAGGGALAPATQRELWNTMGKKDTGFTVNDSTVLFVTVAGGTLTRVEQQPFIVLS